MATWKFDMPHTEISFSARHMMFTTVRGKFESFDGTFEFDEANPEATQLDITVDVNSVNTNNNDRDNHLRSGDFFEVEKFPQMTFKSTGVNVLGNKKATLTGDLTIRDVTNAIELDVEFLGQAASPFGDQRAAFTATGIINREDFGLTWNVPLEAGGVLVSKEINLAIDVQVILQTEGEAATAGA